MGILYLRFLIGGLNVVFVVIVACVTLALALTISFKSLRDNADTAVSRLGAVTAQKVDAFFATPQQRLDDIGTANARFAGLGALPSESPTFGANGSAVSAGGEILQSYRQLLMAAMVEAKYRYMSIGASFADGSYLWLVPSFVPAINARILATTTTWPTGPLPTQLHPLVSSGHLLPGGAENPQVTAVVTGLMASFGLVTDLRLPQVRGRYDAIYAQGTKSSGSNVSWGDFFLTAAIGQQFFFLYLNRPLYNQSGFLLGFADLVLSTGDVSALLTEGQLTPATRLVIYDEAGFLFGASSGVQTYAAENFTGPTTQPGCTTTNQSNGLFPSDVQLRACRFRLKDTPIPMVRDAVAREERFFMDGTTRGAVKLIGAQYVYVQKLPTLQGTRAFTIAMVVPEEDMIGDAKTILPLCAGVTVGVVVFVAAASFLLVWLVLRPLQGIAERMGKAARLEEDDESIDVSSLVEIGDLQRAFIAMRDELARIRAFVPQSLLHANDDEELEAYDIDPATTTEGSRTNGTKSPGGGSRTEPPAGGSFVVPSTGDRSTASFPSTETNSTLHIAYAAGRDRSGKKLRAKLQLAASVKHENVSVLAVNMRGYHAAVKGGLNVDKVASMVEAVLRTAQQEKGVVDSFHGDRFMVSFNAVKPAANHGIRAALVAARISAVLQEDKDSYALRVTAGVATGPAQVGNLGSSEMKRFSIVGPVVTQAACLERLCKMFPEVSCLVPQRLFADLRTAVLVRTADYVQLPFARHPMLVGAVVRELSQAADDEWMYQLQQAAEDPADSKAAVLSPDGAGFIQRSNDVWDLLATDQIGDAAVALEALEAKAGEHSVSVTLRSMVADALTRSPPQADPSPIPPVGAKKERPLCRLVPRDFGSFYSEAVLDAHSVQHF